MISMGLIHVPSGELTKSYGKIHHAINGKIHYFDWAMFNCFLYVHQRVILLEFPFFRYDFRDDLIIWILMKQLNSLSISKKKGYPLVN